MPQSSYDHHSKSLCSKSPWSPHKWDDHFQGSISREENAFFPRIHLSRRNTPPKSFHVHPLLPLGDTVTATWEQRTPNRSEPKQNGAANNFTNGKHTSQVHLRHRWAQSRVFLWQKHRINLPGTSLQFGDQREVKPICITPPARFQANLLDLLTAGHFYRVIVLQTVPFLLRTQEESSRKVYTRNYFSCIL